MLFGMEVHKMMKILPASILIITLIWSLLIKLIYVHGDIPPTSQPSIVPSLDPTQFPTSRPSKTPTSNPLRTPSSQPTNIPSRQPSSQPIRKPSCQPSRQPFRRPSSQPIRGPSCQPSKQPSKQPIYDPTSQPSSQPVFVPTMAPSTEPSINPTLKPSYYPTFKPKSNPTLQPVFIPSVQPSRQPSLQPLLKPKSKPSRQPSVQPFWLPSSQPIKYPSSQPSRQPIKTPSSQPIDRPSNQPSKQPLFAPSSKPSFSPSRQPLNIPSTQPSTLPTWQPFRRPSKYPTSQPTVIPISIPSQQPSSFPSISPSINPSTQPINQPTNEPSMQPTNEPSKVPTIRPSVHPVVPPTFQPTCKPSVQPTLVPYEHPTVSPSKQPSKRPSTQPSLQPFRKPSSQPSSQPIKQPSAQPASHPSSQPSIQPYRIPSSQPMRFPYSSPSSQPSCFPARLPNIKPTTFPSSQPTGHPFRVPSCQPNDYPSKQPTLQPLVRPSLQPSKRPTLQPISKPSSQPLLLPLNIPTSKPSNIPLAYPLSRPSSLPSKNPLIVPSSQPSFKPILIPSLCPTLEPVVNPTFEPSASPSTQPSRIPSMIPIGKPINRPTSGPSNQPTRQPIQYPSKQPTRQPLKNPTKQPIRQPSMQPSKQPLFHPTTQPITYPSSQPSLIPFSRPSDTPTNQPTLIPSLQSTLQPSNQPFSCPRSSPSSQPTIQPSRHPLILPSLQPIGAPSSQPHYRPSHQPSMQPSAQPLSMPSKKPSHLPTLQPVRKPTNQPIYIPTFQPSIIPSQRPSHFPSISPSSQPSGQPASQPSCIPSSCPSLRPSEQPSTFPTHQPSRQPNISPSKQPTIFPSSKPFSSPTKQPYSCPSIQPSRQPSQQPSLQPSRHPTSQPSYQPINRPSSQPSYQPNSKPSMQPVLKPSSQPSNLPTVIPSNQPDALPTTVPSVQPSLHPSRNPSRQPIRTPSGQPSRVPSNQPTKQPFRNPTSQPIRNPTKQPTNQPSGKPTFQPSKEPSTQPSCEPTLLPTLVPSILPSQQPSEMPSLKPTKQPSKIPSHLPSMQPSRQPMKRPSRQPTKQPTVQPTRKPSRQPSGQPTRQPSKQPSIQPTRQPLLRPTRQPLNQPSSQPSRIPSSCPTFHPSLIPSTKPTFQPIRNPSLQPAVLIPSNQPSRRPSFQPVSIPTKQPTKIPSKQPSCQPSLQPRNNPSSQPTKIPSFQPLITPSRQPSIQPSKQPVNIPSDQPSRKPSIQPSQQPSIIPTCQPSLQPTRRPSQQPIRIPSRQPTTQPTKIPSRQPTLQPTKKPSTQPVNHPTLQPEYHPSSKPSSQPSAIPSFQPSTQPSDCPSLIPTSQPTYMPSYQPTIQPSRLPSKQPTRQPSAQPFIKPSRQPTSQPSKQPTRQPTSQPSSQPSFQPTLQPSKNPSIQPSIQPSSTPTNPTSQPTRSPSHQPNCSPTVQPSNQPSCHPSCQPSYQPSCQPSNQPSIQPSMQPSCQPSMKPTIQPSINPTIQPSTQPTAQPSLRPTYQPTAQPTVQPTRQPSKRPSFQPTGQPTVRPTSSKPTSYPTSHPSLHPATSHPTRQHQTNRPSKYPTSVPTYDMIYLFNPTFKRFQTNLQLFRSQPNQYVFSSFYFKGLTVNGTCNSWQNYLGDYLIPPLGDQSFESISTIFEYYNFDTKATQTIASTCADKNVLKPMIKSLISGMNFEENCDGHTWRIFTCNANRVLCIDCKISCRNTVSCPGTSFTSNPCDKTCKTHTAASTIIGLRYVKNILYPIIDLPVKSFSLENTIGITTNISKAGVLYCAAFQMGVKSISLASIRLYGNSTSSSSSSGVTVYIGGLSPDTLYDIYCYTDDTLNHVMPIEISYTTKTTIKSACCRRLVVTQYSPIVTEYFSGSTIPDSHFIVNLNSPPVSEVDLNVSVVSISCQKSSYNGNGSLLSSSTSVLKSSGVSVHPGHFTFYPSSKYLVADFVVRGTVRGCFMLNIEANDNIYLPANISFAVESLRIYPPPPSLTGVYFSDTGDGLIFNFDRPTDYGATKITSYLDQFLCNQVIFYKGIGNSRCRWLSSTQLFSLIPNKPPYPSLNDLAILLAGIAKASCLSNTDCSAYKYSTKLYVNITSPLKPIIPIVSLSAASEISFCDNFIIDGSASTGFGGRPWQNIKWDVTGNVPPVNISLIESYLNRIFNTIDNRNLIASIPSTLLTPSATYTITLTVTNFLLLQSSASVSFTVLTDSSIPQVRIYGANQLYYRWNTIQLYAIVTQSSCASPLNVPFNYKWVIYSGTKALYNILSSSFDYRFFIIPPYTLNPSSLYTVKVSVYIPSPTNINVISSSSIQNLVLARSKIVAIIKGGSSRTISIYDRVKFDATQSYDLDYPNTTLLSYNWSCIVYYPNYGVKCPTFPNTHSSIFSIPPLSFQPLQYKVQLTVSNIDGFFTNTFCILSVIDRNIPSTLIETANTIKYNPGDKIVVTGLVSATKDAAIATWSFVKPSASDSFEILTPLKLSIGMGTSTAFQLGLRAGNEPGVTYSLQLQAYYLSTMTLYSSSQLDIIINGSPTNGVFTVTPNQGRALDTIFLFSTQQWIDTDLPLSYSFSSFSLSPSDSIILKSIDPAPTTYSVLGVGIASIGYVVTSVVTVYDTYNANSSLTFPVTVSAYSRNLFLTASKSLDQVENSFINRNPSGVISVLSSTLSSFTPFIVDCSTVPVPCASLNRQICTQTSRTCGPCLTGYVGIDGDSNSLCNTMNLFNTTGQNCLSNSTCVSGFCSKGKCSEINKKCPNNCGFKGICKFIDPNNNYLGSCSFSDPNCQAVCVCFPGNYGKDCSLKSDVYNQLVSFREYACFSLRETVGIQQPTLDVLISRSLTITSILSDISLVSQYAITNCSEALILSVSANPDVTCDGDAPNVLSKAISSILDGISKLGSNIIDKLNDVISTITYNCQKNLALGEKPHSLNGGKIKTISTLYQANGNNTSLLKLPRSTLQSFLDIPANSINFGEIPFSSDNSPSGVSVAQYPSDFRGKSLNTSSIEIQSNFLLPSYSLSSFTNRRLLSQVAVENFTVLFQNNRPINYVNQTPVINVVKCLRTSSITYNVTTTCPSIGAINITCPIAVRGKAIVSCPNVKTIPQCISWNGVVYQPSQYCKVNSYSSLNTSCSCYRNISTGRSSNSFELSTRILTEVFNLQINFIDYSPLVLHKNTTSIVVTLYGVVGFLLIGFFTFIFWDRSDAFSKKATQLVNKFNDKRETRRVTDFFDSLFPNTFPDTPWFLAYWGKLCERHNWLSPYCEHKPNKDHRSARWVIAMGKLLSFLFVNTILGKYFFSNDSTCEDIYFKSTCDNKYDLLNLFHVCEWNASNESCQYIPPPPTLLFYIPVTVIVLLISSPIWATIDYLVIKLSNNLMNTQKSNVILPDILKSKKEFKRDEFRLFQTLKSNILRAARLEKARKTIDFTQPNEETELILIDAEVSFHNLTKNSVFKDYVDAISYRQARYGFEKISRSKVLRDVIMTRRSSNDLKNHIEIIENENEKEIYLMRSFLTDLFFGYQRKIIKNIWVKIVEEKISTFYIILWIVMLLIILGGMSFVIFLFGRDIGSLALNTWVVISVVCLLEDIFILETILVYIDYNVITYPVLVEMDKIINKFKSSTRLILGRTRGLMRESNCLVQHFSPACRVARVYPSMPISRLLLSLSDHDLSGRKVYRFTISKVWKYFNDSIFNVVFLPRVVKNMFIYISITIVVNLLAMILYLIATYLSLPIVSIVVAIAIVCSILIVFGYAYLSDRKKKFLRQKRDNENMFNKKDDESKVMEIVDYNDELDESIPTDNLNSNNDIDFKFFSPSNRIIPLDNRSNSSFRSLNELPTAFDNMEIFNLEDSGSVLNDEARLGIPYIDESTLITSPSINMSEFYNNKLSTPISGPPISSFRRTVSNESISLSLRSSVNFQTNSREKYLEETTNRSLISVMEKFESQSTVQDIDSEGETIMMPIAPQPSMLSIASSVRGNKSNKRSKNRVSSKNISKEFVSMKTTRKNKGISSSLDASSWRSLDDDNNTFDDNNRYRYKGPGELTTQFIKEKNMTNTSLQLMQLQVDSAIPIRSFLEGNKIFEGRFGFESSSRSIQDEVDDPNHNRSVGPGRSIYTNAEDKAEGSSFPMWQY